MLASAAISALVLPRAVGDRIATDGAWVRNFPLGHAYKQPGVELIVSFRYLPTYPQIGAGWLPTLRRRLERFSKVPPVRALIAELVEAEERGERGEPAHWGDMIVRLMRVAVQQNTVLEEQAAHEKDVSLAELQRLRDGRRGDRPPRGRAPRRADRGGRRRAVRGGGVPVSRRPARAAHRRLRRRRRAQPRDGAAQPGAVGRGREARADRPRLRAARRRAARARSRLAFGRHDLAGIHDPVRVEELLDAAVERHEVAVLALEVAELAEADPVLARAGAAAGERVVDDAPSSAAAARATDSASSGSSRNATWKFPSPTWPTMPPRRPEPSIALPRVLHRAGELGERDGDVGRHRLRARGERERGVQRVVAGVPDPRPGGRVALGRRSRSPPSSSSSSRARVEVAGDARLGAAELDEEMRRLGEGRVLVGVQRGDRRRVDELAARDEDAGSR